VLGHRFENRSPKIGTLINGSPQQFGLRPGTVPVPVIGSFLAAVQWGETRIKENEKLLLALRERLITQLPSKAVVNGPADVSASSPRRAPQTISFSIPGLPSAVTVEALSARVTASHLAPPAIPRTPSQTKRLCRWALDGIVRFPWFESAFRQIILWKKLTASSAS